MNDIKLLSSILKRTNTLIKSEEHKEAYRKDNLFLRKRKLYEKANKIGLLVY